MDNKMKTQLFKTYIDLKEKELYYRQLSIEYGKEASK